jgi:hypothetical protein
MEKIDNIALSIACCNTYLQSLAVAGQGVRATEFLGSLQMLINCCLHRLVSLILRYFDRTFQANCWT